MSIDPEEVKPASVAEAGQEGATPSATPKSTRKRSKQKLVAYLLLSFLLLTIFIAVSLFVLVKTGVAGDYIKAQFASKMERSGIEFKARNFSLDIFPFRLTLNDADFRNRKSGQEILKIKEASIDFSIKDFFALQLRRDVTIHTVKIDGVDFYIKLDKDGRSNLSGVNLVEDDDLVQVNFHATRLSLKNGKIHFGDDARDVDFDIKGVTSTLNPIAPASETTDVTNRIDFRAEDASFRYGNKRFSGFEIVLSGILGSETLDVTSLQVSSEFGTAKLNGSIKGFSPPEFNLKIESNLDVSTLTKIALPEYGIVGKGVFKGELNGKGEDIRILGEIVSEELRASDFALKALDFGGNLQINRNQYEINGNALAEFLTFSDIRFNAPNINGSFSILSDGFNWKGSLGAATVSLPIGTVSKLSATEFIAGFGDERFNATIEGISFGEFNRKKLKIADINAKGISIKTREGKTEVDVSSMSAARLSSDGLSFLGLKAGPTSYRDLAQSFLAKTPLLTAKEGRFGELSLFDLGASAVEVNRIGDDISYKGESVKAERGRLGDFELGAIKTELTEGRDLPESTTLYSRGLQIASIENDAVSIGSVEVAGFKFLVFKGNVSLQADTEIKASTLTLRGSEKSPAGTIRDLTAEKFVYVLDPDGEYRATSNIKFGNGTVGSLRLGSAKARVELRNDVLTIDELNASVLGGKVLGTGTFALSDGGSAGIKLSYESVDISEIFALFGGVSVPARGTVNGEINLDFSERSFGSATGRVTAKSDGPVDPGNGLIPISGGISAAANDGKFRIEKFELMTPKSIATATGVFDFKTANSDLDISVRNKSSNTIGNAVEIEALVRPLVSGTEIAVWADENRFEVGGDISFRGNLWGDIYSPLIAGDFSVSEVSLKRRGLGALTSSFRLSADLLVLTNGALRESDNGLLSFNLRIPRFGANNIDLSARLFNFDFGSIVAVIPYDFPPAVKEIDANTTGVLNATGLPGEMSGSADFSATRVILGKATFDEIKAKATLSKSEIVFDRLSASFGSNSVEAPGSYDLATDRFDFSIVGTRIPIGAFYAFVSKDSGIRDIGGQADLKGSLRGSGNNPASFAFDFDGSLSSVTLNNALVGDAKVKGITQNGMLNITFDPIGRGGFPMVDARIELRESNLPFSLTANLQRTQLEPLLRLLPLPADNSVGGIISGSTVLKGFLSDDSGGFSFERASGQADITQMEAQIGQTSIAATKPFTLIMRGGVVTISDRTGVTFSGSGSDLVITGSKAIADSRENNLTLRGKLNLGVLNILLANTFLGGTASLDVRLTGTNSEARLNGSASLERSSLSTFVSAERLSLEQLSGKINFTSNRVDINSVRGTLGGGKVSISGVGTLLDDFRVDRLILNISGERVRVPFPKDFQTVGNANLRVDTERIGNQLKTVLSGRIVPQKILYETDIDLAGLTRGRRDSTISSGSQASSLGEVILDLSIEGRNALEVRNNLADLTANLSLRVSGDAITPSISGRVSSSSGSIFFRRDRYEIQRAELVFPPQASNEPIINLQAIAEIRGYQVIVSLNGPISDTNSLALSVRSNPALPQADVISLITTGNLSNTESGIPSVAQSGINTAAEVLTNEIINKPVTRATDKLFGLNRFELDPIISGSRLNPTARLTVGRQINRDLAVTYSTNLSDSQNQVVAFEYRVSNRISFVAQYEQRELSNVTRQASNFSFEVRLKRRF